VVQHIQLEGHPDALGALPQEVLSAYLGQCLIAEEVNALLGDLNRWYQQRGWTTTRVYAAEQDITGGELVLRVVVGRIEGYRYNDKDADDRLTYAFPEEAGGYLNLRDLEQGLENLNRVPSQEAKFQLYPGKEPGTSVVVVEMTEKPRNRWTQMVDNSGNTSMGHWRSNTEFATDNLLGRNDQLAIGYNRNLDRGTLGSLFEGVTANYSLSRGNHLWGASLAVFKTDFTLPGTAYATSGASLTTTTAVNVGAEGATSWVRDESQAEALSKMLLTAVGTGIGYKATDLSKNQVAGITNSFSNTIASKPTGFLTIEGPYSQSLLPSSVGAGVGSVIGEKISSYGDEVKIFLQQFTQ
jgi:hemolysin activation/secretion protein